MSSLTTTHSRLNPLTKEWVLVSPQRMKRPWQGQVEKREAAEKIDYDPKCYLCPGNKRANNKNNPQYEGIFVFENDFPAIMKLSENEIENHAWKQARNESGTCKVICYSDKHGETLSDISEIGMQSVISTWISEFDTLIAKENIQNVQIFENRGEVMGCSNPHPHGQIWATSNIPNEVAIEDKTQAEYYKNNTCSLLEDVIKYELNAKERIVLSNEHWLVIVPYWAMWPYETLVLPRRKIATLSECGESEQKSLGSIWQELLKKYDKLFDTTMPFSCGWHQAPKTSANRDAWHAHAHFYPPLLRSATVKKFMVGYEMLGSPQRDLTPEVAANNLLNC